MHHDPVDQQSFIFVGGLHRSGTTLLADYLGARSDASGLSNTGLSKNEGQFLQTAYMRDSELGGAGSFAFDPRAHRECCEDAAEAFALRSQMLSCWHPHWDQSRRFLIEKSPGNCLNARFLQSVFGDQARFVFISRHPIANALATRKWSRTSLFALISHWLHAHDIMRAEFSGLRHAAWISYEALVENPAAVFAQLQEFLGMAPEGTAPTALKNHNGVYLRAWTQQYIRRMTSLPDAIVRGTPVEPTASRRAVWMLRANLRRSLLRRGVDVVSTGREAAAIVAHCESRVRSFGYSLTDLSITPPAPRLLSPNHLSSFNIRSERDRILSLARTA